jgi:hypothetical protein
MSLTIKAAEGRLVQISRTAAGVAYERFINAAREQLGGMSSEAQQKAARANADFIKGLASPRYSESYRDELGNSVQRAVGPGSVHVDTLLATMSVMYRNDEYIGERIMPAVPVSKRSDKFAVYPKREGFAFPDDEIGHRASPNELDPTRNTDNYSVRDYGFKNYLDLETVQNQDAPLNEMVDVVEQINEGIAFKREKRILALVFTAGTYGSQTTTATTNWNDSTGGSIIADILAARSALWTGASPTRKVGFTTLSVWNTGVANNPALRDLFKYTQSGLATTTQIAQFFGLDDILVSQAREDTANSGQTASYARMATSDVFGIGAVAQRPSLRSLHFGSTFRMAGDPFTTEWPDPGIGKRGGIYARVSVSEDHKVVSADAAYFLTSLLT